MTRLPCHFRLCSSHQNKMRSQSRSGFAQAVQAAQITVEDYVMRDIGVAPLTVVGWEGVWGCAFMFAILLPVVQARRRQPHLVPCPHSESKLKNDSRPQKSESLAFYACCPRMATFGSDKRPGLRVHSHGRAGHGRKNAKSCSANPAWEGRRRGP